MKWLLLLRVFALALALAAALALPAPPAHAQTAALKGAAAFSSANAPASLSVSASTNKVALIGSGPSVLLANIGNVPVYVALGGSSVTASMSSNYVIPAGGSLILATGGATYVAGVTASSTSTLLATVGFGNSFVSNIGFTLNANLNGTTTVPMSSVLSYAGVDAGTVFAKYVPQEVLGDTYGWVEQAYANNQVQGSTHGTTTIDTLSTNVNNENWLAGATITDADGDIPASTTISTVAGNGLSITISRAATGSHTGDTFTVSGARENQVLYRGWNLTVSGGTITCANSTDPAVGLGFESHWINTAGHVQPEWHQVIYAPGCVAYRWIDASMDMTTNVLGVAFAVDYINFEDKTTAVHATWNFDTPLLTISDPVQFNGNVTFDGSKTVTFQDAISGSPTWTGSPTFIGALAVQGAGTFSSQIVAGGTSQHGNDALTATMLANSSGISITGAGGSYVNPTLTFLTKDGPIGEIRIAGGGESALYVGGTSSSGSTELSGGVLIGADINGGATFPYMAFGTSTIQFNNVSGGTASKYVCTDSNNNIVIQAGAC